MADNPSRVKTTVLNTRQQLKKAVLNKLIPARNRSDTMKQGANVPTQHELLPIVKSTMQRVFDSENMFDVLPDLLQVAEIGVSSILSTKDLITTTLVYECNTKNVPVELKNELLAIVRDYFDNIYPLRTELKDIVFDARYRTGSYAIAIIPESSVDRLINAGTKVGTESFKQSISDHFKPRGILGPIAERASPGVGLEAFMHTATQANSDELTFTIGESKIVITDNPEILKLPKLRQLEAKATIRRAYDVGLESDGLNFTNLDTSVYKQASNTLRSVDEIMPVETAGRTTIGHPLAQHIPSEAVIPVTIPGDPKRYVGVLVVLDEMGNPVSRNSMLFNPAAMLWNSSTATSQAITDAAIGLGLSNRETWTMQRLMDSYSDLVESKLIASLKNGAYGDTVNLIRPEEVYRIMLARALAKRATQLLYIPSEQFVYFAFDYDDFGIGRSLIDRNKVLGTVRSALMFATMQASVLNACRNVQFTITLAPTDREPEKTIADVEQRIMEEFANRVPFSGTPDDMLAYIKNAGVTFNIEGNDYYPSTKVVMADNTPDYKVPDKDLEDLFQKRHTRGLMVDPELTTNPQQIEFASQVTSKDLLTARNICQAQQQLAVPLTHFVKTYVISDGIIRKQLAEKAREYYADIEDASQRSAKVNDAVSKFVEMLSVTLPPPDTSMLNSQSQQFDDYATALDKYLDLFVTTEQLEGTEFDGKADSAKMLLKNHILRGWVRKNNVDPDLLSLVDSDNIEETLASIVGDGIDCSEFTIRMLKRDKKRRDTLNKNQDVGGGDTGGDVFGGGGDDGGFGGGDGFDAEGGDGDNFDTGDGGDDLGDGDLDSGADNPDDFTGDGTDKEDEIADDGMGNTDTEADDFNTFGGDADTDSKKTPDDAGDKDAAPASEE